MGFRPEFVDALSLIADAIEELLRHGHKPPVLVGGAAVELFTTGEITSPPRGDMIDQAVKLYRLATGIDRDYLSKRIAEETAGDHRFRRWILW
jgi:hypothetical protein